MNRHEHEYPLRVLGKAVNLRSQQILHGVGYWNRALPGAINPAGDMRPGDFDEEEWVLVRRRR